MNDRALKLFRIPSLVLATALQVLPMVRAALPITQTATNILAIIFKWSAAASALGGVQAVSGASTVITNPLNLSATQGQSFSQRLTTAPDQAHYWTASGLPAGLQLTGTTGQTLWRIQGTPTVSGTFNVGLTAKDEPTSKADRTTTGTMVINIAPSASPPSITTQPGSQTVLEGQIAIFTVSASGTAPLSYQWRFNNSNLAGQTGSTLTLNNVTTAQAGSYDVVVSNGAGPVTSLPATLTVNVPVIPVSITSQPSSQTVLEGQSATFTVSVAGTAPLSYQWRFKNSNLAGQTSSTLTLNNVTTAQAGSYDAVVSNSAGPVTSSPATLTVNVPVIPVSIASHPSSQTVLEGQTATFTVNVSGSTPLSYQWRFNNSNLAGQTSSTLTLNNVTTAQAGSYDVVVSNGAGPVTSSPATLTVNVPVTPVSITTQPSSQTVLEGQSATFTVNVSGSTPLSYQWRFNNSNLAGQTSSTLTLNNVTAAQAGSYDVVVSNSAGPVISSPATLTVNVPVTPVSITTQPSGQTVLEGQSATFTVSASGTAPLSYQWRFNSSNLTGQITATLTLNNVTAAQAGSYDVVVSNSASSVTSSPATLTVNVPVIPVSITSHPTSQTILEGQSVIFGVSATGTAPLSYQWKFNSADLAGQNGATLKLTNATPAQGGDYMVVISNGAGSLPSATATLTVTPLAPLAAPKFAKAEMGPDKLLITFVAEPGVVYTLVKASSLEGPWQVLSTIPPTGSVATNSVEVPLLGEPMGFLRLQASR